MGGNKSKPARPPRPQTPPRPRTPPPPPSPKLFNDPWRTASWSERRRELEYVQEFHPGNVDVRNVRILLHGPVGAGKSTFVNSVNSVLQRRMTCDALTDSHFSGSFTKEYTTHKIRKGNPGTFYPFVFNDVAGLEASHNTGVRVDDIKLAMKGHVKHGYKFNYASSLCENDPGYNKYPTLDDRVHVLVCVIPADSVSVMSNDVMIKMRDIRLAASDLGIPQLAIFTKIDKACPLVKEDIKNVYKSKYLKKKMEEFSLKLGIPMNCILPVKNYHEETDFNDVTDILILKALRQMLDFGSDFTMNNRAGPGLLGTLWSWIWGPPSY